MFSAAAVGSVPAMRVGTALSTAISSRHPFSSGWAAAPTSLCKASPGCYFTPEGSHSPGGFCLSGIMDQVISMQHFSLAQFGLKLKHLSSGCWPGRHPAEPSDTGCGICCGKGAEGIPNTVFQPNRGSPAAGAVCRAPGWCHRWVVGASRHQWGQLQLHLTSPHACRSVSSSSLEAVVSAWQEVGLGSEQGGRGQGCREGGLGAKQCGYGREECKVRGRIGGG